MTFMGKENEIKPPPAKQREYEIVIDGETQIVWADYISRDPGHVCFWKSRPDNLQDTLVTAIANHLLDELKEVTA